MMSSIMSPFTISSVAREPSGVYIYVYVLLAQLNCLVQRKIRKVVSVYTFLLPDVLPERFNISTYVN